MHTAPLKAPIEALLFMSHKPISLARIQELVDPAVDLEEYRTALSDIMSSCFAEDRGIELVEVAGGFQFRTKLDLKDVIHRLYTTNPIKLSQATLEVLSIVAYNQPLTREKIDQVRGVDCSHLVRNLLDKKLLRMVGKSDEPGKPMLYGTTKEFLELFGLKDLSALPTLRDIEDMLPVVNEVGTRSEEEELAGEMAEIVAGSKPLEFNDLELEEFENETQNTRTPINADGNGGAQIHDSEAEDGKAGSILVQPVEVAGSGPMGPEGNA